MITLKEIAPLKAEELRYGNLVNDEFRNLFSVIGIMTHVIRITRIKDTNRVTPYDKSISITLLKPIALTKEWFKKHATCKDDYECYYFPHPTVEGMRFYLTNAGYIQESSDDYSRITNFEHIKSVHLFQNLYYSLCGTELIINEACDHKYTSAGATENFNEYCVKCGDKK